MIVGPLTLTPAFEGYQFRNADIEAMMDSRTDVWNFKIVSLENNVLTVDVTFDLNTLNSEHETKVIATLLESPLVAIVDAVLANGDAGYY